MFFLTPTLKYFFDNKINSKEKLLERIDGKVPIEMYAQLDDNDVFVAIKQWQYHDDFILSFLSKSIINRNLLKIELQEKPFSKTMLNRIRNLAIDKLNVENKDIDFIVFTDSVKNNAYSEKKGGKIYILGKNNELRDIAVASDVSNVAVLSKIVEKFFLFYTKDVKI